MVTVGLVSILTITIDRYELTTQCLGPALSCAGAQYELLSADNGSTDRRVIDYISSLQPVYHRLNSENEGYAAAINQLIFRSKGEYICVLDPDLTMPENWLDILVKANLALPNSGLSGYHCVQEEYEEQCINGCNIQPGPKVFGVKFFHRRLLDELGYFDELALYGNEDVAFNYRLHRAGYMNYYIGAGYKSIHVGEDASENNPYRQMKWRELKIAADKLSERFSQIDRGLEKIERDRRLIFYTPPPPVRWLDAD